MWFPTMWYFTSVDSDEPVQPPFQLETPNDVQSVVLHLFNINATSKGSDQTAVCAGWSEALLVAHTILLEISCRG